MLTVSISDALSDGSLNFTAIDPPGAMNSDAIAINNSGQVVGDYDDNKGVDHTFLYSNGLLSAINLPGMTALIPVAINNSGEITGWGSGYDADANLQEQAWIYDNGIYTTFDMPGATSIYPVAIADNGDTLGVYSSISEGSVNHYFIYNNGNLTTIDPPGATSPSGIQVLAINASGEIIGNYSDSTGEHGFIFNNGIFTTIDAPGATQTYLSAINDSGEIAVYSFDANQQCHAFLYDQGTFTPVDVPGSTRTDIVAISDSGTLAGYYDGTDGTGLNQLFVYENGIFTTIKEPNSTGISGFDGINAVGEAVGYYEDRTIEPFIYNNGHAIAVNVPGAIYGSVRSINASGDIIGSYTDSSNLTHAFIGVDQSSSPLLQLSILDTTSGQNLVSTAHTYTGPVASLQNEYINITSDNLNITASSDNWFIHAGSGQDIITAHGGTNVLDGGSGSNFLIGGSGTDTFFVDDRNATADTWSTVDDVHTGDICTLWGLTPQDFALDWEDGQGAAGFTGLTLHASAAEQPTASITLVGYSKSDLDNGRLSVTFGTETASGSAYMMIRAND